MNPILIYTPYIGVGLTTNFILLKYAKVNGMLSQKDTAGNLLPPNATYATILWWANTALGTTCAFLTFSLAYHKTSSVTYQTAWALLGLVLGMCICTFSIKKRGI